jgi:CBS-domain-containing membrane protein
MSTDISSLTCEDTVDEAVRLMGERQVRRLPVVDSQGRVVGIVAQADLAEAARQQGDLEDELAEVVEEISEPSSRSRAE